MKIRKAQAGNQAAILVIVIAVLLILFILSISPEEREKLLNNGDNNNDADPTFPDSTMLIRVNPGLIKYTADTFPTHEFAPFHISADTSAKIISSMNALYIKNSAFEKIPEKIVFSADTEIKSNLLLNFNVERGTGSLLIKLNGLTIFNAPLSQGSSPPIHIPRSQLKNQNELEFFVSGPGLAFWRYNHYSISNLNIYADVLDLTRSKTTQLFSIDQEEAQRMKASTLRYLPSCNTDEVKDMNIKINGLQIFSGIPDCEIFGEIPVPIHYLKEGINEVSFEIRQGRVLIDRARIQNTLEEHERKLYYFEVKDTYFNIVNDDYELKPQYESMLDMKFPDTKAKRFEIVINGKPINFNTARLRETRNMQMFIQPGTNSLEIVPRNEFSITEITIRIREK